MCGFLNDHGTNPNLFGGQFISLDEWWNYDDRKKPTSSFVSIEEIGPDHVDLIHLDLASVQNARDVLSYILDLFDPDDTFDEPSDQNRVEKEQEFERLYQENGWRYSLSLGVNEMADELGISRDDRYYYKPENIVQAWTEERYGKYFNTGGVITPESIAPQWGYRQVKPWTEAEDTQNRQPYRKGKRHELPWKRRNGRLSVRTITI